MLYSLSCVASMLVSSMLFISGVDWCLSWLPISDPSELGKLLGTGDGCLLVGVLNVNGNELWVDGNELGTSIGKALVPFWGRWGVLRFSRLWLRSLPASLMLVGLPLPLFSSWSIPGVFWVLGLFAGTWNVIWVWGLGCTLVVLLAAAVRIIRSILLLFISSRNA